MDFPIGPRVNLSQPLIQKRLQDSTITIITGSNTAICIDNTKYLTAITLPPSYEHDPCSLSAEGPSLHCRCSSASHLRSGVFDLHHYWATHSAGKANGVLHTAELDVSLASCEGCICCLLSTGNKARADWSNELHG